MFAGTFQGGELLTRRAWLATNRRRPEHAGHGVVADAKHGEHRAQQAAIRYEQDVVRRQAAATPTSMATASNSASGGHAPSALPMMSTFSWKCRATDRALLAPVPKELVAREPTKSASSAFAGGPSARGSASFQDATRPRGRPCRQLYSWPTISSPLFLV